MGVTSQKKPALYTGVRSTSKSVLNLAELDALEPTPFEEVDPKTYADWYLHSCYPEIPFHDEKIILDFLVREAPKTRGAGSMLELGCGPVISHALPFAPFVDSIVLSDYLDSNLELVRRWLQGEPAAHNWSLHTAYTLRREGKRVNESLVRERESLLRNKIKTLVLGDLLSKRPIRSRRTFPLVCCFYASEQAATDQAEWLEVLQNLGSLVAPGGRLLMACVKDTPFYAIHDYEKNPVRIPIVRITEKLTEKGIRQAGFSPRRSIIESVKVGGLAEEGLDGVILVSAVKTE